MARVVLASNSPRRRELLGLVTEFDAIATPIEEDGGRPAEAPSAYARRLARRKAERALFDFPDRRVIAADAIVVMGDDILGKPHDAADARSMLVRLRDGGAHQVIAAVAVGTGRQTIDVRHETSEVAMRDYSDAEIERYVASGDPMDKAGGVAEGLLSECRRATPLPRSGDARRRSGHHRTSTGAGLRLLRAAPPSRPEHGNLVRQERGNGEVGRVEIQFLGLHLA